MAPQTLSSMLNPKAQFGQMGRASMNLVGQPGQQGQPQGPGAAAPAPMQAVPGMGAPTSPMVLQPQQMMPAQTAVPGAGVDPMMQAEQIAMVLAQLPPEQVMQLLSTLDPQTQQVMIQIVAMLNPGFGAAIGMAPQGPQVEMGGLSARLQPVAESPEMFPMGGYELEQPVLGGGVPVG